MASPKTSRRAAKVGSNGVHAANGTRSSTKATARVAGPSAGERAGSGTKAAKPRAGVLLEYAPAPETVKVTIAPTYDHFIAGAFAPSSGGETFATINPATEAVLSRVAQGTEQDVDRAVQAARAALPAWQALPGAERGKYLYRLARRIQERSRELAILETMDGGKPIRESRDVDLPLVAQHFFYHAGWADKLEYLPFARSLSRGGRAPAPVGVCGQIIPWNFPLLMAAWKIAPALACGNTVVLKPAETTPLTALRLAEICQEIDLPPGVVNIVTGDGRTGAAIVNHPGVDKIAFTGSTEVGKKIASSVASTNKKLTLELGGKGANIIFDDASIDQAVEGIIEGIYFNQGHVCCAGSRLLVQEGVARKVIDKLTYRLASLRVGDPLDKNTDIGAINSAEQLARIQRYLTIGCEQGAQLVVGGAGGGSSGGAGGDAKDVQRLVASATRVGGGKGYFCRPCVLTGVQPAHTVAREEIFGPVLSVMTFRTPEEALLRANNTPYGLGTGVWTDKGSKILELARKLEAGIVWLNTYNKFDAASPFGGYKESGFGREGGVHGLRGYVR
ncbi:MAG: aldehyde dehydrogenase family protein [Phycisphaerales bacterium]|jgi:aldehyde dehydrogenase (NAD+)|nr:aldehyde dehydrogenase family protein [Phycisphaerales bacterium]